MLAHWKEQPKGMRRGLWTSNFKFNLAVQWRKKKKGYSRKGKTGRNQNGTLVH